jgi:hypothetical protein
MIASGRKSVAHRRQTRLAMFPTGTMAPMDPARRDHVDLCERESE